MLDAMSAGSCGLICRLCCHGPWHWLNVCWFGLCCLCQCLYSSKVWEVASKFVLQSCCSKIAEAEAAMSVNEKKWLVMHMHVQLQLDELRGPQTLLQSCWLGDLFCLLELQLQMVGFMYDC
jgi:hypothetical protein